MLQVEQLESRELTSGCGVQFKAHAVIVHDPTAEVTRWTSVYGETGPEITTHCASPGKPDFIGWVILDSDRWIHKIVIKNK